jgi:hypothetical protein
LQDKGSYQKPEEMRFTIGRGNASQRLKEKKDLWKKLPWEKSLVIQARSRVQSILAS